LKGIGADMIFILFQWVQWFLVIGEYPKQVGSNHLRLALLPAHGEAIGQILTCWAKIMTQSTDRCNRADHHPSSKGMPERAAHNANNLARASGMIKCTDKGLCKKF
jgi:hypothetical protein